MPKVEYGIDIIRIAELNSQLSILKTERIEAFMSGDTVKQEYCDSRMVEITSELEVLNGVGN